MSRPSSDGIDRHTNQRHSPDLVRKRFSKSLTTSARLQRRAIAASVASTSSGWTKSTNGIAVSSSLVKPSTRSKASLTRLK